MDDDRLWVMVDVETSGPLFGTHSLIELGAAVGSRRRGVIDTFGELLAPISEHVVQSRRTFARARSGGREPRLVLEAFEAWTAPYLAQRAAFVARPAAFDWPWVVYYAWTHLHRNPFGFKAVCASSWFEAGGRRFQVELPHVAVEDARIQLELFLAKG